MISINNALNKIINESPFLEDGLYHEYINLTSLSIYIKPQIEILTKKEVTIGAIKMALSRYIKDKKTTIKYKRFDIENFFIKKDISVIYLKNDEKNLNLLNLQNNENYLSIIHGKQNSTIIFSNSIDNEIKKNINKNSIEAEIKDLAIIGIQLDENRINEIGIIYTLTKKINFSNINIVEIITNYKEIHLIIKEEDLKKTIDSLVS